MITHVKKEAHVNNVHTIKNTYLHSSLHLKSRFMAQRYTCYSDCQNDKRVTIY